MMIGIIIMIENVVFLGKPISVFNFIGIVDGDYIAFVEFPSHAPH